MSKGKPKIEHKPKSRLNDAFRKFAHHISMLVGTSWAFIIAILIIVVWGVTGPFFQYSDTWQLVINTSTTIITFLMVFVIQNTQNRQDTAIQIKLDELLRGVKGARTSLVDIEELSDEDLEALHEQFERLHEQLNARSAHKSAAKRKSGDKE